MTIDDDALLMFRALVLHVATGSPLSDSERQAVKAMAVLFGASIEDATPPLTFQAVDDDGLVIECNSETEMDLMQIGTTVWLVSYLIRLSGDVDKRRRRVARSLVEYFETKKAVLGLQADQPVLFQYLKLIPHLRGGSERSDFLGGAWLPAQFLRVVPDIDNMGLDRLFATPRARLTLYKICYWFAAASGRRHASVIDCLGRIRAELQLERDPRCPGISAAVAADTCATPPALRDPERSQPLAAALAHRVVAGTVDVAESPSGDTETMTAERLVAMIPEPDRLATLAFVFDVAMRETKLSPSALGCIARLVDAIDPSEGDLTGILMRHELDSGKRIRLPRAYTIDYGKQHLKYRATRVR